MKKIILIGMKGCGKTTIGKLLAKKLNIDFIDSDLEIENLHKLKNNENLSFREIYKKYGEVYFNCLDRECLLSIYEKSKNKNFVLACAGRTPLKKSNQEILVKMGEIIYIKPDMQVLYERITKNGIPAFFPYQDNPRKSFEELIKQREPVYKKIADITIESGDLSPEEIIAKLIKYEN